VEEIEIGPPEVVPFVHKRQSGQAGEGVAHAVTEVQLSGVASSAEAKKSNQRETLVLVPKGDRFGTQRLQERRQFCAGVNPSAGKNHTGLQQHRGSNGYNPGSIQQILQAVMAGFSKNGAHKRRSVQQHQ